MEEKRLQKSLSNRTETDQTPQAIDFRLQCQFKSRLCDLLGGTEKSE